MRIAHVAVDEFGAAIEVRPVTAAEIVEDDDGVTARKQPGDDGRADEAGAPSDQRLQATTPADRVGADVCRWWFSWSISRT